jgi:hypothetical protein
MPSPLPKPLGAQTPRDVLNSAALEAARYAEELTNPEIGQAPGDLIEHVRRLRVLTLKVLTSAVLVERRNGATWDQLAAYLGVPEVDVRAQYEGIVEGMARHEGLLPASGHPRAPVTDTDRVHRAV